jgi:hypothetical protein
MIPVNAETHFGRRSCSDSVPRVWTVLPATTLTSWVVVMPWAGLDWVVFNPPRRQSPAHVPCH